MNRFSWMMAAALFVLACGDDDDAVEDAAAADAGLDASDIDGSATDATSSEDTGAADADEDAAMCESVSHSCDWDLSAGASCTDCCEGYACLAEGCRPSCELSVENIVAQAELPIEALGFACQRFVSTTAYLRGGGEECPDIEEVDFDLEPMPGSGMLRVVVRKRSVGPNRSSEWMELGRIDWDTGLSDASQAYFLRVVSTAPNQELVAVGAYSRSGEVDDIVLLIDLTDLSLRVLDQGEYGFGMFLDDDLLLIGACLSDVECNLYGVDVGSTEMTHTVVASEVSGSGRVQRFGDTDLILVGAVSRIGGRDWGLAVIPEAQIRTALSGSPIDVFGGDVQLIVGNRLALDAESYHGRWIFQYNDDTTVRLIRTASVEMGELILGEPREFAGPESLLLGGPYAELPSGTLGAGLHDSLMIFRISE